MLPSTPSIATSYPDSSTDIDSQQKVLTYLQAYNKSIVATTQVVQIMIYVTVFWLLPGLLTLVYIVKLDDKQVSKKGVREVEIL